MGSSYVFAKLVPESSKLTTAVMLLMFYGFHSVTPTTELYEKLPLQGTSMRQYQTGFKSESIAKCALVCAGRGNIAACIAFIFHSTTGTCDFYCAGQDLNAASSLEVFMTPRKVVFRYVYVEGQLFSIYFSNHVKKTFLQAREHCQRIGGYLLQFDSQEEYQAVEMFLKGAEGTHAYIGANSIAVSTEWVNDRDGTAVDPVMFRWRDLQPDNLDAKCAVLVFNEMRHNDVHCEASKRFICERDLVDA